MALAAQSRRFFLVLTLLLAGAASGQDHPENPHRLETKIRQVAVFKNGMGFFLREGAVTLRDGWCYAPSMPPAAFGTLVVYSHEKDEVVDTVGSGPGEIVAFDGVDAADDLKTRRERLEASLGLKVRLEWGKSASLRNASGTLVSIGEKFAILDDGQNSFAVPLAKVTRLQILDLPVRIHVAKEKGGSPTKTKLGMGYLRKGITWIPEYTLEIVEDGVARLTLRGTVINEAEDLIHTDVNLVVGVPHFAHSDKLAPLALGHVIRSVGAAVAPSQFRGQIMNRAGIVQNFAGNNVGSNDVRLAPGVVESSLSDLANLPRLEEGAGSDYSVYTRKNLTLRKGEKAIIPLFVKTIRFEHSYRWEAPGRMKHFLELLNGTDSSWTTGPCLAMEKEHPLSEDLLRYTPRGGRCRIPVSDAINISHRESESEIERKLKAHTPRRDISLDLVTVRGVVKLRNMEKRPAKLHIAIPVQGRPMKASHDGVLRSSTDDLRLQHRKGRVVWDFVLEPGKAVELEYEYERYVPSR